MSGPEPEQWRETIPPQGPEPLKIPWEDPEHPRLAGLLATMWQLLRRPGEFFRFLPRDGWQQSLSFGLIAGTFGLLATFYTEMLLSMSLSEKMQHLPGFSLMMAQTSSVMLILMLFTPVLVLASVLLGTLCLWAALRLQGVASTFALALKINAYSQGGLVVAVIPVAGVLAALCWNLYLNYKGLREMFGMGWWRSWGTVTLSLGLEGLLLVLAILALVLPLILSRLP